MISFKLSQFTSFSLFLSFSSSLIFPDITQTASYGTLEHTPLIVNGGPELSKTPPHHQHLLTTPSTLRKAGQSTINNSDNFSEDEGVGPGTEGHTQPVFKLDS